MAKIVAQIGAILENFETLFAKDEYHEQALIDINVLRFPDVDQPYFKVSQNLYLESVRLINMLVQVYRIKLAAWSDSSRNLMHQEDTNGITGGKCTQYLI